MAQVEYLVQTGFTDIHTDYNHFFTQEGQADCRITCYKGFTFARLGRREEDNLVVLAQHKEEVGTKSTEGLFHNIVLVFTNHNSPFFWSSAFGQFCQNTDIGDAFHILAVFNFVFQ